MKNKKILFVVEGHSEEEFIDKTLNIFLKLNEDYDVIKYNTSVYELYDLLIEREGETLIYLLRESGKIDKKLFNDFQVDASFSFVYLVFDFDRHYQKFSIDKMMYLARRFNDASDEGQLIINFPMFESIYDISKDFSDDEIIKKLPLMSSKQYKKHVKGISYNFTNNQFHRYIEDLCLFEKVCHFNLKRYYALHKIDKFNGIDTLNSLIKIESLYSDERVIFTLNLLSLLYFEFEESST